MTTTIFSSILPSRTDYEPDNGDDDSTTESDTEGTADV